MCLGFSHADRSGQKPNEIPTGGICSRKTGEGQGKQHYGSNQGKFLSVHLRISPGLMYSQRLSAIL